MNIDLQRQSYQEEGFVVIRQAFDVGAVASMVEAVVRIIDRAAEGGYPDAPLPWRDQTRKLPDCINDLLGAKYDPVFGHWLDDVIIPAAESLLEAPIRLSWLTALCAGGGIPYHVPWHRDSSIVNRSAEKPVLERDRMRQCYLHAPLLPDDSFLQVIPGSHARLATEAEVAAIEGLSEVDLPGQHPIALQPGDIALRHGNIIHRGLNPMGIDRWHLVSSIWRSDVPVWKNEVADRETMMVTGHLDRLTPRTRDCVQRFLDAYSEDQLQDVWEA